MTKKKFPTYDRYTKFDYENGISNKTIEVLESRYEELKQEQSKVWFAIENIHDNCVHDYKFTSRGMHEDFYKCSICGHKIEK